MTRRLGQQPRLIAIAVAVLASVMPAVPMTTPARAAGPVFDGIEITVPKGNRISGTVRNGNGDPLAGISVSACTLDEDCRSDAVTAANGTFTIRGLVPDQYALFVAPADFSDYLAAWHSTGGPVDEIADATVLDATAGNVSGVVATMGAGFRISGTITGAGAGALVGVSVEASGQNGSGAATTNGAGQYTIRGLRDGTYSLMLRVPPTLNFRSGSVVDGGVIQDPFSGTPVEVAGGHVTGVNVVAPAGRRLSGVLTGSEAAGAGVSAFGSASSDQVTVAANGQWSINGLWPGTYQLVFSSPNDGDYSAFPLGYWSGAPTLTSNPDAAANLVVASSNIGGISAAIPAGLTLSGTVVNENGGPLGGAYVYACGDDVGCASGRSDSTGKWSFRHLRPDTFLIAVGHPQNVGGYFGSGGYAIDESYAAPVSVSTTSVSGVDVVLPSGATFTGHIAGPLGEPVAGANVHALGTGGISPAAPGGDTTAADGSFELRGLTEDDYVVSVSFEAYSDYISGYFDAEASDGYTDDYDLATILSLGDAAIGSSYVPINPKRVVDSRTPLGVSGVFSANVPRTFAVAGINPIPSNAIAVTGNVTVVNQTAAGFVSLTPTATANPKSSTINVPFGDIRANNFTLPLSPNGNLSAVFKATAGKTAHVIVDITGYFLAGSTRGTYATITPTRILDSRNGTGLSGAFGANTPRTLSVAGAHGIPADAVAITGNLTVVGQTRAGFVAVTPSPTANPPTSTINFPVGDIRANGMTARLNTSGDLSIVYKATGGSAHVLLDVTGYYRNNPGGLLFYPLSPGRVLDTRPGALASELAGTFNANTARTMTGVGVARVPLDASALTGNLTVVGQTAAGYLAVTLQPVPNPTTSTLNFPFGDVRANGITVPINLDGELSIIYRAISGKKTHAVLDITGYFR